MCERNMSMISIWYSNLANEAVSELEPLYLLICFLGYYVGLLAHEVRTVYSGDGWVLRLRLLQGLLYQTKAQFQIVKYVADDLFFGQWSRHVWIYYRFGLVNFLDFEKSTYIKKIKMAYNSSTTLEYGCRITTDVLKLKKHDQPYWSFFMKTYVNACGRHSLNN